MSATAAKQAPLPEVSLDEWAAMDEDEPGELVDGQIVEEEVVDPVHEDIVSSLNATIRAWVVPRGGFVLGSETKFSVRARRGRKADLSVFLPGGAVPPRRGVVTAPPDIMIEVISRQPGDVRRDRIDKVDDYAAFGVRFYWLIEPEARTLEILELGALKRYTRVLGASGGVVEVPGCSELRLDLDALWAEIDRLGPPAPVTLRPRRKAKHKAKR